MVPIIFSTHSLHPAVAGRLEKAGELRFASAHDPATLLQEGKGASVIIVRAPLPEALVTEEPLLRAAVRHGAGLDMIPVATATRAGVLVANVPGANASTVAEHVFFSSMALLRRFRRMDHDLRNNGWESGRNHSNSANDLAGRVIGIVGLGNVGREVFRIAHHGFKNSVLVHTRSPDKAPAEAKAVSIDDLIEQSDIVVLCCPLTPQTEGLISGGRLARMKSQAILINVARGPVVDEAALINALESKQIAGAALDVFSEQPLRPDHPLFSFDNVLITPHMAGITEESMLRMGTGAADETIRILKGELPVNLCNPEVVERYRNRFG